ncbi:CDP-glycerol glycerophosphotransferase family protein [Staphylococcus chromogenes]|uniref:CDP-glycerol glycerophosphotransferase family protein n=1 Tax=Staphylococcus chromogenes TaxID=46126 RepID=UPI00290310E2|nr:CDP-glycerol glycerophosphotransferase family protein [Staphylococcus chromogenes]MDU0452555.1 CDP-glycerol glycerophosphotransferase family protein [Staphylococcus chromogenes]
MFVIIKNSANGNIYIKYNSRVNLILKYSEYDIKYKNNKFFINGVMRFKENPYPDAIMTKSGKVLSKLKWTNSENFIAELKMSDILNLPLIHNTLYLSKNNEFLIPLKRYNIEKRPSKKIVYKTKTYKKKVLVLRLNLNNNISLTVIPNLPVYNSWNKLKINLAYKISRKFRNLFPEKINLFFEKEASKTGESGSYIFEKVMNLSNIESRNYFILDKKSKDFKSMKMKWKNNLIKRFSFKHYLYIFLAQSFISSELSSHVISGRLFEDKLSKKIKETPLYFLQHGIMFAKPVDNPMAAGFHKENMMNNVVKNVISSDLEAEQFYKMGYDDSDLMKTGLPKFDGAYLNKNADKITYMPTWRYWEENEILNGNITNTTYYKSFISLIKSFEDANLLDLLQITAHNKFSEFITESLPQYKSIICEDPTEALKNSKIFITDYSSIIYDAIFRGTYPIFYWKDKDYLINNYQAIPPVNDENAPGKIAYSEEELIKHVKSAIDNNFLIEDENLKKYRMINEFYDRQNSDRVINVLKKDNIL